MAAAPGGGEGMDVCVGQDVLVNGKHRAVIRYIGRTTFAEGTWIGLELQKPIGKHEGTVLGVSYFTTPKKHATFVKRENIAPYEPEDYDAAARIQSGARLLMAKRRMRTEMASTAFNRLDADEESQQLARQARLLATPLGQALAREHATGETVEQWEREANAMPMEAGYDGPVLTFPITPAQVLGMMAAFKDGRPLHYRYVLAIASAYRRWAMALPVVLEAAVAPGERMTVVGDTHGQLADLYSIFSLTGVPSATNRYLFNGDYVDRGEMGVEVLVTLMAWCLAYPGTVGRETRAAAAARDPFARDRLRGVACIIHRGNHESHAQNMTGGFMTEVLSAYSGPGAAGGDPDSTDRGLRLYDAFQAAFDAMPLASVICRDADKTSMLHYTPPARNAAPSPRIFVVHGGLFHRPGVTLAHLATVKRHRDIPFGLPSFEDKLFEDMMWSDPRPMNNSCASDRGAGVFFGADVTAAFCALNGISLVIRSHECVPEGFQFSHNDELLTIFSASHYCGRGTNKGAVITFDDMLASSIQQYIAGALEAIAAAAAPAEAPKAAAPLAPAAAGAGATSGGSSDGISSPPAASGASGSGTARVVHPASTTAALNAIAASSQNDAVHRMLVERIVLRKSDLYAHFSAGDKPSAGGSGDGRCTKRVWMESMKAVLNLDLPWSTLCESLADPEADGRINFTHFLDRYRIAMRPADLKWMESITDRVSERLFAAFPTLEASFKAFDEDGSGSIEFAELEKGLCKLDLGLSRDQVYELMSSMDTDGDGRICVSEFMARFKYVFNAVKDAAHSEGGASSAPEDAWGRAALHRIAVALYSGKSGVTPCSVFKSLDANGDGTLSDEEFGSGLQRLGLGFSPSDIVRITSIVDANNSGAINFKEFSHALKVHDTTAPPLTDLVPTWSPRATLADDAAASHHHRPVAAVHHAPGAHAPSPHHASWQRGVIDKIVAVLYEYRVELAASFAMFDTDRDGKITLEELKVGLQSLGSLTGSSITDMQVGELMKALDTDGDGSVSYEEFVQGFRLVDAGPRESAAPSPSTPTLTKSKSFALSKGAASPGAAGELAASNGGAAFAPPKEVPLRRASSMASTHLSVRSH